MAETTHPDEAPPVCPSLRLRRIEGLKSFFLSSTLFAAPAGERFCVNYQILFNFVFLRRLYVSLFRAV
jgi:hypothetical protein